MKLNKPQIKALQLLSPDAYRVAGLPELSPRSYRQIRDAGLIEEAWTWANITRPSVRITDAGLSALRAAA